MKTTFADGRSINWDCGKKKTAWHANVYMDHIDKYVAAACAEIERRAPDPKDQYIIVDIMLRVVLSEVYNLTSRIQPGYDKSVSMEEFFSLWLPVFCERFPREIGRTERNHAIIEKMKGAA